MIFNTLQKLIPFGRRGAALLPSYRVNSFLTKLMTGNKSGPLLLTTFILTLGAANGWFTFRRTASAVPALKAGLQP